MNRFSVATALTAAAIISPAASDAATQKYRAVLTELNNSGVSGHVNFLLDDTALTLAVSANISGLAPSLPHVNHIHGRFDADGNPIASVLPDASDDDPSLPVTAGAPGDGDGLIEVFEAADKYGDVILSLENPEPRPGSFHNGPVADADGRLSYSYLFDISDPDPSDPNDDPLFSTVGPADYTTSDLLPLDLREYVIHGLFVDPATNPIQTAGGVQPDGTIYSLTTPVAAATLAPVPLPAPILMLIAGIGGLGIFGRYRR